MKNKIMSLLLAGTMALSIMTPVMAAEPEDTENASIEDETATGDEGQSADALDLSGGTAVEDPQEDASGEKPEPASEDPYEHNVQSDTEGSGIKMLDAETAFAVYCEDDGSLTFCADQEVPEAGALYNGKNASSVYTGFEGTTYSNESSVPWNSVREDIRSVIFDESFLNIQPTAAQYWFTDCVNLASVDFAGLDASQMKNMGYMFQNCSSLEALDFTGINTESATSFYSFLEDCSSLTDLNLDGIYTGSASNFHTMFAGCVNLEEIDVSGFDVSKASMMYGMFRNCSALKHLDLSNWDTGSVTSDKSDTFFNYFASGCVSIEYLTLGEDFDLFAKANKAQVDAQTWYNDESEVVSENYLIGYSGAGNVWTDEQSEPHVHTIVIDEAVEPTCTSFGYTEGSHCSECGEVIVKQERISAIDHDFVTTVEQAATCTEDGVMRYKCSMCGRSYTEPIEATGHVAAVDKAAAATCTKSGLTEGSHCSVCGTVLKKQETIKALGHNYKWVTDKKADYGIAGSRHQECTRCGAKGKAETLEAKKVGRLYPQVKSVKKTSQKLSWNSIKGATKYVVYGSKCSGSVKKLATVKNKTSYTHKGLKKGTYYKYYVVAYNGSTQIAKSYTVHAATAGGKYGNPNAPKVKKSSLSIKAGKTAKANASVASSRKMKKHTSKLRYYSSDSSIAKVSSSGKITAKKKGSCNIYAVAQNGKKAKIKVTVK